MEAELTSGLQTGSSSANADVTREELHFRRIDMRGFRRSDGLFEAEAHLIDRKPYDFTHANAERTVPANAPIHDLGVRLVFDEAMVIHDVQTFTDSAPYDICPEGGRALQSIKGLRIAAGWSKEVRSRLSGARSCTHLMELLIPLATTAIQSTSILRQSQPEPLDANGRPKKIDSCYAYSAEREVVLRRWPRFHQPASPKT
ncbi:hypothetical protein OKW40_005698 [Paraburkholderia sp. RAU6.4a]|uniref:DUF2889 domain-containing protein n=1 Tax=Paraburkholderia sp. RAU6.4a TaxID=2991067 RepID=UPI003D190C4E